MNRIIKWLNEHGIEFTERVALKSHPKEKSLRILLESDCVWINGFGEPMKYDRIVSIQYAPHGGYLVVEKTGYSMSHTLCSTTKSDRVIQVLEERFMI